MFHKIIEKQNQNNGKGKGKDNYMKARKEQTRKRLPLIKEINGQMNY